MGGRYFEDFVVGQTFASGRLRVTRRQIKAFAADPTWVALARPIRDSRASELPRSRAITVARGARLLWIS
jgi:hypothetical protein